MSGPAKRAPVPSAHPMVKFLHRQCEERMMFRNELARRAGLSDTALQNWWDARGAIILENLEAALGVFGYGLTQQMLPSRVKAADIKVGESYRVRCGQFAHITACDGNLISGYLLIGKITLQWNMAGQRIPRGGEDPMDLILVDLPKREAA